MKEQLIRFGLTDNEAKVYLTLLESGGLGVKELVDKTKLARGVVYFLVDELINKELVLKRSRKGKNFYVTASPIFLKDLISDQLKEVQTKDSVLTKILPDLLEKFQKQTHSPVIQFYDGREGVKKVYQDTLQEKQEILAILQRAEIDPEILRWLRRSYTLKRARLGIPARVILAQDEKSDEYVKESKERLRDVVTVPKDVFPVKMEVDIYGSKVGFISCHKEAPHFGVIVNSPYVADALRGLWNLAWIGAQEKKIKSSSGVSA
ncbi:hypothetical protein KJ596_00090 [Patescibacteria group bacterium]|nr:hypothetical protein [Patescibacteria group bacterium]MBU1867851.1 hypothetical protein [Patescibacteria group bacterium]